ncbi:MAG TPA: amino acid--tRNA ligase-related protein, partial [Candidatus Acidoferrum sp.]|nr:amino acid--tRNA ligase-related protein [Candidatus Acidoferrum sp.]
MDETHSLIEQRKAKLAALRAKGIDPFRNKFTPTETCKHASDNYVEDREVAVAGRITAHRDMGKSMFIDVRDESGRLQVYAQKNMLGDDQFDIFRHLDLGDFMGARGTLFKTKTGEISIRLMSFTILAKALRPPPEKWHGLADTEIRYRQRYLDLIANPEVKDVFLKRSQIIREIRNFLNERSFVEVETPMMQAIPGGAAAQPFKTYHNALGCDFYLRIALELSLKRLLVGGMDRVYEIGRNFRNEGLSRKHNPEFTMLEAYQAYGDYESMMELVQSMVCQVAQKVLGTLKLPYERPKDVQFQINCAIAGLTHVRRMRFEGMTHAELRQRCLAEIDSVIDELRVCSEKASSTLPSGAAAQQASDALNRLRETLFTESQLKRQTDREVQITIILFSQEVALALRRLRPLCWESIDLTPPWKRVRYKDAIIEATGKDWFDQSPQERLVEAEHAFGIDVAGRPRRKLEANSKGIELAMAWARFRDDSKALADLKKEMSQRQEYVQHGVADFEVTQAVFEDWIEPTLIQPAFVTHLPKELVPLAKLSPEDPTTVEVFECCINGQEISPAYTEQNDPIEQRERLEHQAGGEQQKLDEDFL